MTKNGVKTKIDVAVLQEKMEEIQRDVVSIMENHIPHLHAEIDDIKVKMAYYAGGITVAVSAVNYLLTK